MEVMIMKKTIRVLLCMLVLVSAMSAHASVAMAANVELPNGGNSYLKPFAIKTIQYNGVNIRLAPRTSSASRGHLQKGDKVERRGISNDGKWYYVYSLKSSHKFTGWVNRAAAGL